MTLQEIAWTAGALSLVISTATFVFNVVDRVIKERRDELLKWQRAIVYSIIQDGAITFEDIKLRYLAAAQQISDIKVPKKEIQDSALKLVLLSLVEGKLVSVTPDWEYLVNVTERPDPAKKQMEGIAYQMFIAQQVEKKVISRIYEMVEGQPGVYTIDSLHRQLKERQFDIEFEALNLAVRNLVWRRELFLNKDGRLFAQSQTSQPQASSQLQPGKPAPKT